MRILWVKAGKLLPVDTGGKIRSYNILRHLSRTHEVTFLSAYDGEHDAAYENDIARELPGSQATRNAKVTGSTLGQYVAYLRGMFRTAPFAVSNFASPAVRNRVTLWLNEKRFDVAVCDFLAATINFPSTLATPSVLFQHNVESAPHTRVREKLAAAQSTITPRARETA